jgi:Ca2+-binding EF-hand superfamily protein
LNLRGGKLDGFAAVIIDNLAAADHFESLLCTSRSAISNAFRSIDLDDSGHISKSELEDALRKLGVNATDEEVESIFNGLDENKDGGINFEVRAKAL